MRIINPFLLLSYAASHRCLSSQVSNNEKAYSPNPFIISRFSPSLSRSTQREGPRQFTGCLTPWAHHIPSRTAGSVVWLKKIHSARHGHPGRHHAQELTELPDALFSEDRLRLRPHVRMSWGNPAISGVSEADSTIPRVHRPKPVWHCPIRLTHRCAQQDARLHTLRPG